MLDRPIQFAETKAEKEHIARTKEKVREVSSHFSHTDGWKRMSEVQKKIMIRSLFVSGRSVLAERRVRQVNKSKRIWDEIIRRNRATDWEKVERMKSKYGRFFVRKDEVDDIDCHTAVCALEQGVRPKALPGKSFEYQGFFDAVYFKQGKKKELLDRIARMNFPIVMHIQPSAKDPSREVYRNSMHSCILLGSEVRSDVLEEKNILVWEKEGVRRSYRKNDLRAIFEKYPPEDFVYGVRELKRDDG